MTHNMRFMNCSVNADDIQGRAKMLPMYTKNATVIYVVDKRSNQDKGKYIQEILLLGGGR